MSEQIITALIICLFPIAARLLWLMLIKLVEEDKNETVN